MELFSKHFNISEKLLYDAGFVDVDLSTDTPLFVDPILIFGNEDATIRGWHDVIVRYLLSLLNCKRGGVPFERLGHAVRFPEFRHNFLGFSSSGDLGKGLSESDMRMLYDKIGEVCDTREISISCHFEKICLLSQGIGRDKISDFIVHAILDELLTKTAEFAAKHIDPSRLFEYRTIYAGFDWDKMIAIPKTYVLPFVDGKRGRVPVMLTPLSIVRKDFKSISYHGYSKYLDGVVEMAEGNSLLRQQFDNLYLEEIQKAVATSNKDSEIKEIAKSAAYKRLTDMHPDLVDKYIRSVEDDVNSIIHQAKRETTGVVVERLREVRCLADLAEQFGGWLPAANVTSAVTETRGRILYLKNVIENKGGWKATYGSNGEPLGELYFQKDFLFACYGFDGIVAPESNSGNGPCDFLIIDRKLSKAIVEIKLASNTGAENSYAQISTYMRNHETNYGFIVFFAFSQSEIEKCKGIIETYQTKGVEAFIVDCQRQESASHVKAKRDNKDE